MPSPSPIPDDAFHEEAITAADLEGPDGPESDPQYLLIQSAFGFHVKLGKKATLGCEARMRSPSWSGGHCSIASP